MPITGRPHDALPRGRGEKINESSQEGIHLDVPDLPLTRHRSAQHFVGVYHGRSHVAVALKTRSMRAVSA